MTSIRRPAAPTSDFQRRVMPLLDVNARIQRALAHQERSATASERGSAA